MPTNIRVAESTANVPSGRAVRDVSRDIHYLDADAAPYVLMSKRAGRRAVSAKEFEWIEKQRPTEVDNFNGAQTAGDTTLAVDTANAYFVDDLIMNMRTREIMRVTVAAGTSPRTASWSRSSATTATRFPTVPRAGWSPPTCGNAPCRWSATGSATPG